jgi:hypothetical protein
VIKKRERFGDRDELVGPASAFRTAPAPVKASVSLADENGVPDFALPGNGPFWCQGWHAMHVKWFKVTSIKIRVAYPRIHVHFLEDENGCTHKLALPELDAYVHAGMIRSRDW